MKGFCISPVRKPPDSTASDPLISPPNSQFYLWPHTSKFNHIKHTKHNNVPATSFLCRISREQIVFFYRLSEGEEQAKQVTSHHREDGSYTQHTPTHTCTQAEPCRSDDAPFTDGERTAKQRQMVLSSPLALFAVFSAGMLVKVKDSRSAAMLIIGFFLQCKDI